MALKERAEQYRYKNKKAYFDYEILDQYETGIVLSGEEVKSLRHGGMNLTGAYVTLTNGKLLLVGCTIARYSHSSNVNYNSKKDRLLLVRKSEFHAIQKKMMVKGHTIIPLEGYFDRAFFKMKIGIGKGKKQFDKRETIKQKDQKREMDKVMKNMKGR